jgi:hypothetical protein
MKIRVIACISMLAILFALAAAAQAAEVGKGYLWKGSDWKELSPELKAAYVKGMGNMADYETAASAGGQAPCISKAFVGELKAKSLGQVIAEVDKFYQENPKKMDMPVIDVILQRCTKLCPVPEKKS